MIFSKNRYPPPPSRGPASWDHTLGWACDEHLSPKMGNSIQRSNTLWKTYVPVEIEPVLMADAYRRAGRAKMRERNEPGQKGTTLQPIELHAPLKGRTK